jgi:hypothetical protein
MQKRCPSSRWGDGRKIKWFLDDRFSRWLLRSIECELRERQFYCALYLMLLGVEILSGFFEGREPGVETFCSFVKRYFSRPLSIRARGLLFRRGAAGRGREGRSPGSIAEAIWWIFRCGFMDSCAVYPGGSLVERSRYYCRCYKKVGLRLDVHKFHRDFLRAYRAYSSDTYSDYFMRRKFVARFDRLFGMASRARRLRLTAVSERDSGNERSDT